MSQYVMTMGRIVGEIKSRDAANGDKFVFFKLRVAKMGGSEFWSVICFDKESLAELDDLPDGVPICCVGEFSVEPWERDGKHGFNLKLTAHTITRLRQKKRKRGLVKEAIYTGML